MKAVVKRLTSKKALGYANTVGGWYKSFPEMPKGLTEFCVKLAPYLAIISAIISLFFAPIVALISIAFITTKTSSVIFFSTLILSVLFFLSGIILFPAYSLLKKRAQNGWLLLFWAEAVMALETVIRIIFGQTKIVSLFGTALVFYILFQMRSYYKKK